MKSKSRPSPEELARLFALLSSRWSEIVGEELAESTRPLKFTGGKARRLLVAADAAASPPWGIWTRRSEYEAAKRTFTRFRASINAAIAPHEVDHIDFVLEK